MGHRRGGLGRRPQPLRPRHGVRTMSASLTERDLELFVKLRIPRELLERAGIVRVTDKEAREDYGISGSGDMAGIAFPYFDPAALVDGSRRSRYVRIRRDFPETEDGREKQKYVAPYRDRQRFYFPPTPALFAVVAVPIRPDDPGQCKMTLTS